MFQPIVSTLTETRERLRQQSTALIEQTRGLITQTKGAGTEFVSRTKAAAASFATETRAAGTACVEQTRTAGAQWATEVRTELSQMRDTAVKPVVTGAAAAHPRAIEKRLWTGLRPAIHKVDEAVQKVDEAVVTRLEHLDQPAAAPAAEQQPAEPAAS